MNGLAAKTPSESAATTIAQWRANAARNLFEAKDLSAIRPDAAAFEPLHVKFKPQRALFPASGLECAAIMGELRVLTGWFPYRRYT
jgi:hypothetical protein